MTTQSYSHLISGATSGLPCVGCLQLDDFKHPLRSSEAWDLADSFFRECEASPKSVSFAEDQRHVKRVTARTFMKKLTSGEDLSLSSIYVSSVGDDDLADVYAPHTYAGFELGGRIRRAFLYSRAHIDAGVRDWRFYIDRIDPGTPSCAGAIFQFPLVFSPVNYFIGMSYRPNIRSVGEYTDGDSRRITNWRDHCSRGFRPQGGFLRDVYRQNLLASVHLDRTVERMTLQAWIRQSRLRGALESHGQRTIWTIPDENLVSVQSVLDQQRVLLSAFSPDDVGAA